MRIIPVIDVKNGIVVHAVGGRRSEYRPLQTKLVDSTELLDVARALYQMTGSTELYIADLDSIAGPIGISDSIRATQMYWCERIWLDIGIRDSGDFTAIPSDRCFRGIVASETMLNWHGLNFSDTFSIDLRDGEILGRWQDWGLQSSRDVLGLARLAVKSGAKTLLVLDLAGVGTGAGPRTLDICKAIRDALPNVELLSGGGVRDVTDARKLMEAGADGVLVASALHSGAFDIR